MTIDEIMDNYAYLIDDEKIEKFLVEVASNFDDLEDYYYIVDSINTVFGTHYDNKTIYCDDSTTRQFACKGIEHAILLDGTQTIQDAMFDYCLHIKDVMISDTVTKIGYHAFAYCENLTSITIPNSVTEISSNAFKNCDSLQSIKLPERFKGNIKKLGIPTKTKIIYT